MKQGQSAEELQWAEEVHVRWVGGGGVTWHAARSLWSLPISGSITTKVSSTETAPGRLLHSTQGLLTTSA